MSTGGEAFVTATTEWTLPLWSGRLLVGVDGKTPVAASGEEVLVVAAGGRPLSPLWPVAALGEEVFGVAVGGEVSAAAAGKAAIKGGGSIDRDAARAGISQWRMTRWRPWLVVIGGWTWGRAAPRSRPPDRGDRPTEEADGGGEQAS